MEDCYFQWIFLKQHPGPIDDIDQLNHLYFQGACAQPKEELLPSFLANLLLFLSKSNTNIATKKSKK